MAVAAAATAAAATTTTGAIKKSDQSGCQYQDGTINVIYRHRYHHSTSNEENFEYLSGLGQWFMAADGQILYRTALLQHCPNCLSRLLPPVTLHESWSV